MPTKFTSNDPLVCELLLLANSDYVYLAEVPSYARRFGARDAEDERHRTLDALKELLESGFWEVGRLSADGFERWSGSADDALSRIRDEWCKLARPLQPGDICWFANTSEGDRAAKDLLTQGYRSVVED